jgi:hypothetical protein
VVVVPETQELLVELVVKVEAELEIVAIVTELLEQLTLVVVVVVPLV